jgi:site-specific recombinase XerD
MERQPRYQSVLSEAMDRFLAHKRALGRRFSTEERQLLLLDRFLLAKRIHSLEALTPEVLDAFLLSRPRKRPKSYNQLLGVARRLLDWMVLQEMLPRSPLRAKARRETGRRVPVIFDPPLVRSLLDLALQLPDWPRAPVRGPSYRLAFALMYGLGLRAGEVSRLRIGDLDLGQKLVWIRESKFRKTRLLPLGPQLAQTIRAFLVLRRARWGPEKPDAPLLTFDGRRPISANRISSTFQLLMPRLGFNGGAHHSPRAHDLRHSFAVGTLLRWYREGVQPADRLLYLSAFLGHAGIHSTAVYLTITSDLLDEAVQRFEPLAAEAMGRASV